MRPQSGQHFEIKINELLNNYGIRKFCFYLIFFFVFFFRHAMVAIALNTLYVKFLQNIQYIYIYVYA